MKTRSCIIPPIVTAAVSITLFPCSNICARDISVGITTANNKTNNYCLNARALRGTVATVDNTNRTLEYFYYIPYNSGTSHSIPVLIIVPGLDGSGEPYINGRWRDFAQKNGFAIISPTFRYNSRDWENGRSYQFPDVWSGRAMIDILDSVETIAPVDKRSLYLFGFSAGAQYVHRFALLYPERCKAVAVHAPGGITFPNKWIPVKFLVTVGQNDAYRLDKSRRFADSCKALSISLKFIKYPEIGHDLCEDAIRKSLEFFNQVKDMK